MKDKKPPEFGSPVKLSVRESFFSWLISLHHSIQSYCETLPVHLQLRSAAHLPSNHNFDKRIPLHVMLSFTRIFAAFRLSILPPFRHLIQFCFFCIRCTSCWILHDVIQLFHIILTTSVYYCPLSCSIACHVGINAVGIGVSVITERD